MLAQGALGFQYAAEGSSAGLTSLAGLPLYLDLVKASGLATAIQEHVHVAAETMRWADATIDVLASLPEAVERDHVLALARTVRARAFDLMQRLNPEQEWFWTEEWQAGERDVDREIAAGHGQLFTSDEEFDAALDALDAERAALG